MSGEISFPRGGRQTFSTAKKAEANEDLFNAPNERKVKTKRKKKSKAKKEEDVIDDDDVVIIDALDSKNIVPGLIVLGCVTEVFNYSIRFSLPGGIIGTVPITNMSSSYTKLLKDYTEDPDNFEDSLMTMPNMFKVGDCYPVRVMDFSLTQSSAKTNIILSLNPKDINEDMLASSIFNGMILLGAVLSVEDHGFIIDIGIKGLNGFLSTKNASHHIQNSNQGRPLSVGEILHLVVNMPELEEKPLEGRTITLSTKKKLFDADISEKVTLQTILPGMTLPAIITEATMNGLAIKCITYNGCIHKDNLLNPFDDPKKYTLGEEVKATVLFKHPLTQVVHMTLVLKSSSSNVKSRFDNINIGDKFEHAKILEVCPHSVTLKLNDKIKGVAKTPHLFDKEVENACNLLSCGQKIACRVLALNYIDKIVKVSLKKSVLKQPFIGNESIQPGDVVNGKVVSLDSKGMVVKLGLNVQGFVVSSHLSDIPIKHPEKLFRVGGDVNCRVLRLDQKEGGTSHFLTCKKTLVNSKLPPLTSLDNIIQGMIFDGFVAKTSSNGLLISFYNNIKGWVPVSEISTSYIEFPEKVFYVGQVVKCRVLHISPTDKQLKLSLKLTTRPNIGKKDMGEKSKLKVGDIVSLQITEKSDKGLDVSILPSKSRGFVPLMHLSDHPHLCKLILQNYEIGDVIEKACIFSLKGIITCSTKSLLIKTASKNKLVSKSSQIQESTTHPGVIKGFMAYGILVEMGNNVSGMVHKSKISNGVVKNPGLSGFVTHQTLIVKVQKIAEHNGVKRFVLSSRLLDVIPAKKTWKPTLDHLESYIKDWDLISKLMSDHNDSSKITSLKTGQIVNVVVSKISDEGAVCQLTESKIKGIVVLNNIGVKLPKQGDKCQALILHVDFSNSCVELSLCHRLIKLNAKLNDNRANSELKVKKHSIQKCQILLIRHHFALATLLDHNYGIFAYLPIIRHPNDTVGNLYYIGQKTHMTVYRVKDNYVIGVLESHEAQFAKELELFRNKEKKINLEGTFNVSKKNTDVTKGVKRKASMLESPSKKAKDSESEDEIEAKSNGNVHSDVENDVSDEDISEPPPKNEINSNLKVGDMVKGKISYSILGKVYLQLDSSETGFFRNTCTNIHDKNEDLLKVGKSFTLEVLNIDDNGLIELEAPVLNSKPNKRSWAKVGQLLEGTASHFKSGKLFVKLSNNKFGVVLQEHIQKKHGNIPLGTQLRVRIDMVNGDEVILRIKKTGLIPSTLEPPKIEDDVEGNDFSDFIVGHILEGVVRFWKKGAVFVQLTPKKMGIVTKSATKSDLDDLKTGSKVQVQVLKVNEKGIDLKLLKKIGDSKKLKPSVLEVPIVMDEDISNDPDSKKVARLQVLDSFAWDVDATPNLSVLAQQNNDEESSSSEDDEDNVKVPKKRKKGERAKEEEELLRKQEERLMDLDRVPETIDDFERLTLSSPDNSMIWMKYMAFHLQQTEIDKARIIAQRALKTISFREEREKLNIWVALLNLENMYGTEESLGQVFSKALEVNEPLKVYRQMINIYTESEKIEEAEELYQTIIKKYRQDPTVWTDFGLFYMKIEKPDLTRKLMERSFNSLDKRNHIEVISKFAQLEFNYGDPERGKTLFKNVLNNFPKRTDIWSVFIDVLVKHGEIDEARLNLEKLSSTSLPLKKMKFVFKKFLDFEKEHGTEETVDKVKLKALEYVQNCNVAT